MGREISWILAFGCLASLGEDLFAQLSVVAKGSTYADAELVKEYPKSVLIKHSSGKIFINKTDLSAKDARALGISDLAISLSEDEPKQEGTSSARSTGIDAQPNEPISKSIPSQPREKENRVSSVETKATNKFSAKRSKIEVRQLQDAEDPFKFREGSPCKAKTVTKSFKVLLSLGEDASRAKPDLKFYAVLENDDDGKPRRFKDKIFPATEIKELSATGGSPDDLGKESEFTHSQRELSCRCCRNRIESRFKGYYVELLVGGEAVAAAHSDLDRKSRDALSMHLGKELELQ